MAKNSKRLVKKEPVENVRIRGRIKKEPLENINPLVARIGQQTVGGNPAKQNKKPGKKQSKPTATDELMRQAKKRVKGKLARRGKVKTNSDISERFKGMLRRQLNKAGFATLSETFVDHIAELPTAKKINAMRELGFDDERIKVLFTSNGNRLMPDDFNDADRILGPNKKRKIALVATTGNAKIGATTGNTKINVATGNTKINAATGNTKINATTNTARDGQSLPTEGYAGSMLNKNRLVLSTMGDRASAKILSIYNLTLGVDQDKLKQILEEYGKTQLSRVVVRDLPTGSAMASVYLANPVENEYTRLQEFFNGATVDGRTIKVLISEDPVSKLA